MQFLQDTFWRKYSKHNAFSVKKTMGLSLLSSTLLLAACSNPIKSEKPKSDPVKEVKQEAPAEPKVEVFATQVPEVIEAIDPEETRQEALLNNDWPTYLTLSEDLWKGALPEDQAAIEQEIWQNIHYLDAVTLHRLSDSDNPSVQGWALLTLMTQQTGWQQQLTILNLQTYFAENSFNQTLLPQLLAEMPQADPIQKIAVFLPETGKYKAVGQFIKQGIIKSYYKNLGLQSSLRLSFYDSADITQISKLYYQAKQDGADFIIGPIQKPALEQLATIDDSQLLGLNRIDYAPFAQFNLKNAQSQEQLIAALGAQNFHSLAILGDNSPKQTEQVQAFAQIWQEANPENRITIHQYEANSKNFRSALGQLVHETESVDRRNTVRWVTQEKISYFPRLRQDLDVILMLDKANLLAVFNPQLDFYQLDLPVYADSALRAKTLKQTEPNKDLKGIKLLNHPYALNPENLNNIFEAFGWDSLLLALQNQQLRMGGCLTSGKTGILSLEDNLVQQQLVWTEYDWKGQLRPFQVPVKVPVIANTQAYTEDHSDALNNEASDPIFGFTPAGPKQAH